MQGEEEEEQLLRSVAQQTANSVVLLRHRADRELREAKASLQRRTEELDLWLAMMRATLESTTDAILVTDGKGEVTGHNEKVLQMWNLPPEIVKSRRHKVLLEATCKHFSEPEKFLRRVAEIYAASPEASDDILELTDGRVIERFSRVLLLNGENVGRVWSFRDITAARRAERERELLLESERTARAQAERETRMKDEFLSTLSHELRTPLNAILGWAHILRRTETSSEVAEAIEIIDRNAHAQATIIEDLLDMSRIISGKVRLTIKRIDLASLIVTAIESVEPMAAAKEIEVTAELDETSPIVAGDPTRLQQIMWNLLMNALKFTPKQGHVHVVLRRNASQVDISVADDGCGIAPDFLPHVFDRFRQADASSTRRHRGLGLGLAIVKNLVEVHGGEVQAASPGLGHGATFLITLPVRAALGADGEKEAGAAGKGEAATSGGGPSLKGISILVVDDEPDARQLIDHILSEAGATVHTAPSAAIALEYLRSQPLDLLISDIGMPEEDGYALIRRVRQLAPAPCARIPAIALTAFARATDRQHALKDGFDLHLTKPVPPSELVGIVARLARPDRI